MSRTRSRAGARERSSSEIRTFLIADIRGYTLFTRQHGDEAAARLATVFADTVRRVVESRAGSLIELRGDEALVTFGSARQALLAALELQAALDEQRLLEPSLPLVAGVGLDAGEAVAVEGGYRGSALNVASRLCARAGPGEVLASSAVLHLAGSIEGLASEERVLDVKGLEGPVRAHLVRREAQTLVRRTRFSPTSGPAVVRTSSAPGDLRPRTLVGRTRELDEVTRFLESVQLEGGALVFEGAPGIGKSMLLESLIDRARSGGLTVLRARPTAAELALPFAGLADVLDGTLELVAAQLAAPRRRALDIALLRVEASGEPADRLAVALGATDAFRLLAAERPLLVAVDDVMWLDEPTASILSFASRRLTDARVGFVGTERADGTGEYADVFPGAARIAVAPLDVDDVNALLVSQLDLQLTRPALRELHAASAGNPLFALELGRSILREGTPAERERLVVPGTLAELLGVRLDTLPRDARALVALLAEASSPTLDLVERARAAEAFSTAMVAGFLELDGERVRFTHPLLATAASAALTDSERRAVHARLATLVDGDDEQARHLALAAREPDEDVAARLEGAAAGERERGAPQTAAGLLAHAVRLTPLTDAPARARRAAAAAEAYVLAGDLDRARRVLESADEALPPGPERVSVRAALVDASREEDAAVRLERSLDEAAGHPEVLVRAHLELASVALRRLRVTDAARWAQTALSEAVAAGFESAAIELAAECALYDAFSEAPVDHEALDRAVEEEQRGEGSLLPPTYHGPTTMRGLVRMWRDELDTGRTDFQAALERAERLGHESIRAGIVFHLVELEIRAGRFEIARELAAESVSLARQAPQWLTACLFGLALAEAHLGELVPARTLAEEALERSQATGDMVFVCQSRGILGFAALSEGDAAGAHAQLAEPTRLLVDGGMGALSIFPVVQNEVEALVALGRVDEAAELVSSIGAVGARSGRVWTLATAARGRGLVEAAQGDPDSARAAFAEALELHERLGYPFEQARTLMALGMAERRAKQKAAAREALESARREFERLGAVRWAERASAELSRIGLRRAPAELSPTERRVAELAAAGRTNREIAAEVFLSVKTVEANLSKAYRKLGVRSRVELATTLQKRGSSRDESRVSPD
jgi:class 3 adenylate cyclase/DNA-binding CsgD family transcriptional regulator